MRKCFGYDPQPRRLSLYNELKRMPPLPHYPDRSKPFERADSPVLQYIVALFPNHMPDWANKPKDEQFHEANRIFDVARNRKAQMLLFHASTGQFVGILY